MVNTSMYRVDGDGIKAAFGNRALKHFHCNLMARGTLPYSRRHTHEKQDIMFASHVLRASLVNYLPRTCKGGTNSLCT
jgi:hypothetical protein